MQLFVEGSCSQHVAQGSAQAPEPDALMAQCSHTGDGSDQGSLKASWPLLERLVGT